MTFKLKYPDEERRRAESKRIIDKYPDRRPIVCERFHKSSKDTPVLDKTKFLVYEDMTMGQFCFVIRKRMSMNSNQALYLFMENNTMVPISSTVKEVYDTFVDKDGFLYVHYSLENTFGNAYHLLLR